MEQVVSNDEEYYYKNGRQYDRVTKVIGATVGRFEIEAWKKRMGAEAEVISKRASDWGTKVHALLAFHDQKKEWSVEKMIEDEEALRGPLEAWVKWSKETIRKWVLVEQVLFSNKLGIAGTLDRVGYVVGDKYPSIIDIKTGGFWESAGIQVWGAYRELYNENRGRKKEVRRGLVVQLPKDEPGVLRVKEVTKEKYVEGWENAKKDYWNVMGRT